MSYFIRKGDILHGNDNDEHDPSDVSKTFPDDTDQKCILSWYV